MNPAQQILRLVCVPVAMSLFLVTAQMAGGLTLRDTPLQRIAMK